MMKFRIRETLYQIKEKAIPTDYSVMIGIIIMLFIILGHTSSDPSQTEPSSAEILNREQRPKVKISEFAVSETNIFIHYEKEGLVEAYDLEGNYCYSIRFSQQKNGVGHIGVNGNTLYIQDRLQNVYIFQGTTQIGLEASQCSEGIPKTGSSLTTQYHYKQGKIIRNADGYTVLDLSENSVVRPFWGLLVVCTLILISAMIGKHIKRAESKPMKGKRLGKS